ncbi:ras-like protein family member 12 isoform X3 [Motacilla alba alba]|uniref:ras-like protein family member 12 isoform X3 n=1 Tax=Motacilla alba alba TaxID=1094192 RepID=UPI0018D56023|nr:ras-like protein family member 12 isoform X3 [Motacilla alba alba]
MSSMFGKPRASSERPPQSPLPECNVAILGCRGAGKSALTVKFLTKRFISEYDPNLEDTYSSEELVDQQPVLLKVMDTADQDGPGNCERYLCWASAFLVVYSIDNRKSFEGCQRYLEVLALHARGCQRRCPVLLLGNKLDMEQYREGTTRTHRVKQQGQPTSEGTNPGEGHSHQFTPCSWNTPAACGQTPPGELCQVFHKLWVTSWCLCTAGMLESCWKYFATSSSSDPQPNIPRYGRPELCRSFTSKSHQQN